MSGDSRLVLKLKNEKLAERLETPINMNIGFNADALSYREK